MTTLTALTHKEIGITVETVNEIKVWFNDTRKSECSNALVKWLKIGDICSRVKAGKFEGKFSELVQEVLGIDLSNDERQYSMKLFEKQDEVVLWYGNAGSYKYNPRTIYTAWQASLKTPVEKGEKKVSKKDEAAEKELRKERSASDVFQAYLNFKKVLENASENGNMVLGDYETIKHELESGLKYVVELIEIEAPLVENKKTEKGEKMKKDIGSAKKAA